MKYSACIIFVIFSFIQLNKGAIADVAKPTETPQPYVIERSPGASPFIYEEGSTHISLPVFVGHTWALNLTSHFSGTNLIWMWRQNHIVLKWNEEGLVAMNKGDIQMTVQSSDIGCTYQLNVSNSAGSTLSRAVTLTHAPVPQFTAALPEHVTVFAGDEIVLATQCADDGFTRLHWSVRDRQLFNRTQATLTLHAEARLNGAQVTLVATNPAGTASQSVTLRVLWPRWAIAVIVICALVSLAALVFALHAKGCLKRPACLDPKPRASEYKRQSQHEFNEPSDDIELSLDDEL